MKDKDFEFGELGFCVIRMQYSSMEYNDMLFTIIHPKTQEQLFQFTACFTRSELENFVTFLKKYLEAV